MLSVLLAFGFIGRQLCGFIADRVGGLRTVIAGSACQIVTMTGFLLTQDEAGLFAVAAAFGLGFSGIIPAYVLALRQLYRRAKHHGACRACCCSAAPRHARRSQSLRRSSLATSARGSASLFSRQISNSRASSVPPGAPPRRPPYFGPSRTARAPRVASEGIVPITVDAHGCRGRSSAPPGSLGPSPWGRAS